MAAAIALHAPKSKLRGASKQMAQSMSNSELEKFARTERKGLPQKKACLSMEDAASKIVSQVLGDDVERVMEDDEQAEVNSARSILSALERLQASLPNATPDQQHDLTTIRASANSLIRMHGV